MMLADFRVHISGVRYAGHHKIRLHVEICSTYMSYCIFYQTSYENSVSVSITQYMVMVSNQLVWMERNFCRCARMIHPPVGNVSW